MRASFSSENEEELIVLGRRGVPEEACRVQGDAVGRAYAQREVSERTAELLQEESAPSPLVVAPSLTPTMLCSEDEGGGSHHVRSCATHLTPAPDLGLCSYFHNEVLAGRLDSQEANIPGPRAAQFVVFSQLKILQPPPALLTTEPASFQRKHKGPILLLCAAELSLLDASSRSSLARLSLPSPTSNSSPSPRPSSSKNASPSSPGSTTVLSKRSTELCSSLLPSRVSMNALHASLRNIAQTLTSSTSTSSFTRAASNPVSFQTSCDAFGMSYSSSKAWDPFFRKRAADDAQEPADVAGEVVDAVEEVLPFATERAVSIRRAVDVGGAKELMKHAEGLKALYVAWKD